jgi:hypothetical protein
MVAMKQMNRVIDLTGQRFSRLTVIGLDDRGIKGKTYWLCMCDCGNVTSVRSDSLRAGRIKSCGCLHNEKAAANVSKNHKHKMSGTRIYQIWQGMKARCYNKNNARWQRYGGRGITVCSEWKNNFQAFYDWAIASGYQDGLTIDRIDNNGNYCPENCRWATQQEQARNRRTNIDITIGNSTRTLTEWCEIFNLDYGKMYARYQRNHDTTLDGFFNA